MDTVTITGKIYNPDGIPLPNTKVWFDPLSDVSINDGHTVPKSISAMSDVNGDFSVVLSVPKTGTWLYRYRRPSGKNLHIRIGLDTSTIIEDLIVDYAYADDGIIDLVDRLFDHFLQTSGVSDGATTQPQNFVNGINVDGRSGLRILSSGSTTLLGDEAGLNIDPTTVNTVTAVGLRAAKGAASVYLTAIGVDSGVNNTGMLSSFFGDAAGMNNSGIRTSAFGSFSALENSGTHLTTVGCLSGEKNTGHYCVFLGSNTGKDNAHSNVILLGVNAVADTPNQMVIGSKDLDGQINSVALRGGPFGSGFSLQGKTSTTAGQTMVQFVSSWIINTHATRSPMFTLMLEGHTGSKTLMSAGVNSGVSQLSFFGATLQSKQMVGGVTAEAQIDSLITALDAIGLIEDAR